MVSGRSDVLIQITEKYAADKVLTNSITANYEAEEIQTKQNENAPDTIQPHPDLYQLKVIEMNQIYQNAFAQNDISIREQREIHEERRKSFT